jgi:hypothetical protein
MPQRATVKMKETKGQAPGQAGKAISPAAQRALDEAAERRRLAEARKQEKPKEINGQKGPEPTRYGDWEKGGIVSDF